MTVFVPHGRLWPGAAERRARREKQPEVFVCVLVVDYPLRGQEQTRQFDERRRPLDTTRMKKDAVRKKLVFEL